MTTLPIEPNVFISSFSSSDNLVPTFPATPLESLAAETATTGSTHSDKTDGQFQPVPNASTTSQTPQPWIDWNTNPPDGTSGSLHHLLASLAKQLGAEILAGVNDGTGWVYATSRPLDHREQPWPSADKLAVEEASLRLKNCLFASVENQSSMLLQSCRIHNKSHLALSFGIEAKNCTMGLVLAFHDSEQLPSQDQITDFMTRARKELPAWLDVFYLCWLGSQSNAWHSRLRKIYQSRNRWLVIGSIAMIILCIPIPYRPQRECLVEPASRRFVTSPIAGRVIDAQIRPGDVVQPGQLLARIDDQQLRWDLANIEADYQKACKKHDSALASRSGGDLRMAQLEREQYAIQLDSLRSKLEQLEIRSPISGVVVEGDWVPTAGTTVEAAQTLFEIAPLDSMRVRTLLSTEDLGQVSQGTPVTIRVDSARGEKWTGCVERIDPRGRPEGTQVVFEAETLVNNDNLALRPGMRGSTRLSTPWQSLGWLLVQRPYTWLMKKLVW